MILAPLAAERQIRFRISRQAAILGASAIQIIHIMDTCVQLQGGGEDVGAIRNPR